MGDNWPAVTGSRSSHVLSHVSVRRSSRPVHAATLTLTARVPVNCC
ncbi:MAG: hypothetical protein R2851_05970 [Caldilineaceae bacterium]